MSDLERRVADLERRVARAGRRIDAVGLANGRAGVRLRMVRGLAAAAAGTPPVNVPCCPGVNLPATLKLRLPSGVVGDIVFGGGVWEGTVETPMDVYQALLLTPGACSALTPVASRPHPILFRMACLPGSFPFTAGFFELQPLSPAGLLGASGQFYPARSQIAGFDDAVCRRAPYTFAAVGGTRICRPFNAAFRITAKQAGFPFAVNDTVIVYE